MNGKWKTEDGRTKGFRRSEDGSNENILKSNKGQKNGNKSK